MANTADLFVGWQKGPDGWEILVRGDIESVRLALRRERVERGVPVETQVCLPQGRPPPDKRGRRYD